MQFPMHNIIFSLLFQIHSYVYCQLNKNYILLMIGNLNYYSRYHRVKSPHPISSLYSLMLNFKIINFQYMVPERQLPLPLYDVSEMYQREESFEESELSVYQEEAMEANNPEVEDYREEKQSDVLQAKGLDNQHQGEDEGEADGSLLDIGEEVDIGKTSSKYEEEPEQNEQLLASQTKEVKLPYPRAEPVEEEKVEDCQLHEVQEAEVANSLSFTDSLKFNHIPEAHNSQIQEVHHDEDFSVQHSKSEIIHRYPLDSQFDSILDQPKNDYQQPAEFVGHETIQKLNHRSESQSLQQIQPIQSINEEQNILQYESEHNNQEQLNQIEKQYKINKQDQEREEIPKDIDNPDESIIHLTQIEEVKSEEEEKKDKNNLNLQNGKEEEVKIEQASMSALSNQKSQRKPFKKVMISKKLNPRMVTSTFLPEKVIEQYPQYVNESPPKKVNFKKMMKKQSVVCENNQTQIEKEKSEKKSDKKSDKKNGEKSKSLLKAFFEQN